MYQAYKDEKKMKPIHSGYFHIWLDDDEKIVTE
jgi:hypothetical protein